MNKETVSRHLTLLRIIPRHPCKATAQSLYQSLRDEGYRVTKRTVERDLNMLMSLFPITSDTRTEPYGWCWAKGVVSIEIPTMTVTEALTFKMLEYNLGHLLPASYRDKLGPYFVMAERRLGQTSKQGSSRTWIDKIRVVQDFNGGVSPSINSEAQNTVFEALLNEQQIQIKYQGFGDIEPEEHVVSPCAVATYKGVMFLLASRQGGQGIAFFRLHRIVSVAILPGRAIFPKDFDVDRFLYPDTFRERSKKGVRFRGVLTRFAAEQARDLPLGTDQRISSDLKSGHWLVEATVPPNAKEFLEDMAHKDGGNGVLDARQLFTYYVEFSHVGREPNSFLSLGGPNDYLDEPEKEMRNCQLFNAYFREAHPEDAKRLFDQPILPESDGDQKQ